ncbi:hypothetical protein EJP77_05795 [Paenibacillus zeisoli]|uniref:YcdB/YcdC repeated domain-containing protein n=1 Tax=Paenibacillus zeisoli TaxID=2496267 RepID=A0A3S1D3X3_9BACL|nr:YcdB/YcdC domain-containing protein [Paenibacillus zeisoli]RUT36484.1 hypothetical protein EJP77_05795 [Paenibacillus zeisoli]
MDHTRTEDVIDEQEYRQVLKRMLKLVSVPEGYAFQHVQCQQQNNNEVWVFRYEKDSGDNSGIGGEHYSFVMQENNHKLLGITWMDESLSYGNLPSKEETEELAESFLNKIEPGLFERLEHKWTDLHHETILVRNHDGEHEEVVVTGMKYKCYLRDEQNYAWVIFGPGGQLITFEQGIYWEGGRVTEKWLHDS